MASRGRQGKKEEGKAKTAKASAPLQVAQEGVVLKINKWDGSAVKNALDDTAKKFMKDHYSCVEDHSLVDHRLALCTVACSFSLFALVYDYLYPFPQSRMVLAVCAISYFILMGFLSLYSLFVEGTVFMVARHKDPAGVGADSVWTLRSSLPRFSHRYSLSVSYRDGQSNTSGSGKLEKSITEWFDDEGTLVFEKFSTDFKHMCSNAESRKDK